MSTKSIAEATSDLAAARTRARSDAYDAITSMTAHLQDALGDGRIRGLPNLATSTHPYRALRVRSPRADRGLKFRTSDGTEAAALVLTENGQLCMARRDDTGAVTDRAVCRDDLIAEDVEHVAETIVTACDMHAAASDKAQARYVEMSALAHRLRRALEE